jgi:hypothetical protein
MNEKQKRVIDWDAIERDVRAGIRTIREIAVNFGVSHTLINRKIAKEGWTRNLSAKISARAEDIVSKSVSKSVSAEKRKQEREIIEVNAQTQANIVLEHRSDIRRYKALGESLLQELEMQTGAIVTLEELGEMMRNHDDKGIDKLNDLYRKAISTPSRIDSFKKAVETLKNIVGLERQAFGISDNANGEANKTNTDAAIIDAMIAARSRISN